MGREARTNAACSLDSAASENGVNSAEAPAQASSGGETAAWAHLARLHRELADAYAQIGEIQLAAAPEQRDMNGAMTPSLRPLIAATEVAKLIGVDPKTVRRWRDEGRLPVAIEIGGVLRWRVEDIDAWLEEKTR